jgi:hypothetical protein
MMLTFAGAAFAADEVNLCYDAFRDAEGKFITENGTNGWWMQHATIGMDDYENLEFIEAGWFYEFYQNWAQGAVPYVVTEDGKISGVVQGKKVVYHAGSVCDPVITFVAPKTGNLKIPSFIIEKDSDSGDGINFQILYKDMVIFPEDDDWYVSETIRFYTAVPDIYITVNKGDEIYFRVNMRENQNNDGVTTFNLGTQYLTAEEYLEQVKTPGAIVIDAEPIAEVEEKIEVNFTDIEGHWGKDYIVPLAEKGIIKGKSATTFEPDSNITRAEFLTLALNVAGIEAKAGESYADVDAGAWFANTVATAKAKGLIDENMTLDGNFKPDQNITREEMTSVIVKLYESEKSEAQAGDVTVFSDNATFSDWTVDSIGKAVALGVVTGNPDGTFNALGNATRAEAAVIFSRLLNLL